MFLAYLLAIIAITLIFEFVNGFHDAANAIATIVATKVLTPVQAVGMAAVGNFLGAFIFSVAIANTIGKTIDPGAITFAIIMGGLIGAIIWDLITWWLGLPTSSSHALFGGLVGAGLIAAGPAVILHGGLWEGLRFVLIGLGLGIGTGITIVIIQGLRRGGNIPWESAVLPFFVFLGISLGAIYATVNVTMTGAVFKVVVFMFVSPFVGLILGFLLAAAIMWVWGRRSPVAITIAVGVVAIVSFLIANALFLGLGALASAIMALLIALAMGVTLVLLITRSHGKPNQVNGLFRFLQLGSGFGYAVMHGTNDAQKGMGIIAVGLLSFYAAKGGGQLLSGNDWFGLAGWLELDLHLGGSLVVPLWVILVAHSAIALGTFFGGWRIVKTMATRITHLKPFQGFAAEGGGILVLLGAERFGIPVSTTHVIASSIMGVGMTRSSSAVRWSTARRIVWAWVLTIPASALIGAVAWVILDLVL